ncbi:GDSL esterase/lipase At1g29670-like [Primulina eburnea]|uniref:GDSL esterase/lipase At1g29670-like n=1 Tax=Primulina eburnea TaxID=1245227 RepID=UPI003C6C7152
MDRIIIFHAKWVLFFTLCCISMKFRVMIRGQQVPCLFFMGDSLSDNGNNNMRITVAKANYQPYGIDYPAGPTGRFSNKKNIPDYLAQSLGFANPVPPFATATGTTVQKGVNYASGAAGILDDTGGALGDVISLNRQLLNHQITIARLLLIRGPFGVTSYLNKCLYAVNMGSNDYVNNYLLPQYYPSSKLFTPDKFAQRLILQYSRQLKSLYKSGARKVAVFGLGLLGCIPQVLATTPANASGCVDYINNYVQLFNNRLKPLVDDLNTNLPGAKFTYINITSISLSFNLSALGITVFNAPCCIVSSGGQCVPNQIPCSDRDQYIFYDNYHPTDIINQATAARSYNAISPLDASPFDISQLAQQ